MADDAPAKSDPLTELEIKLKRQELINSKLTTKKLRREQQTKWWQVWLNPQLWTAAISTAGIVIGFLILYQEDFFKIRDERAALQVQLAAISKERADQQTAQADKQSKEATDIEINANRIKEQATAKIAFWSRKARKAKNTLAIRKNAEKRQFWP